jgi:K+-transporting ATPase c subunit
MTSMDQATNSPPPSDAVTSDASSMTPSITRGAVRSRAYRARQRRGVRCATIRLTEGEIRRLRANGYELEDNPSHKDLAEAVETFIADFLP